jgi:hypothetical protein
MKKTFIRKGIFACIAAIIGIASSFAQTINTGMVAPASVCAGSSIIIAFTSTAVVAPETLFSVELSDATGVFPATPDVIGSGLATPLTAVIPTGTAPGSGYKVRVTAPAPTILGTASEDFTINFVPDAPVVVSTVTYEVGAVAMILPAIINGLWYSGPSGGTGAVIAPLPITTEAGTVSYYVSQKVGTCESPRSKIDVIVTCATVAPTVVSPVNYIVGATPTALPTQAGYLWYSAATGGTGSATAPLPSAAAVGTTSYFVSQTVNGCEGPRAEIKVIVSACATVAPTVVSPVNYTVGATPTALPTQAGYLWYSAATGGTGSATAPLPSAAAVGTTSYFVSQTVNGCEGPRAEIKVIVSACATVAPTVVSPVNYTVGATPTALPTQAGYLWYSAATGGTGSATAPLPSAAAAGTTSYFVSQTVSGCEGPRAEIKVIVSACATVAPTVVSPVNYIVGATPTALPTQAGYLWYSAATGGTGSATAPIPSATAVGTTSYFVSQTVSGCEGPRAEIKVIVSACATVAPTVVSPVNYIVGATPTALPTQAGYLWYSAATGGTGSATAPIPSATAVGTTSYFVSQTVSGCEGPRAEIKVIVTACATVAPTVVSPVNYIVGATPTALPTQAGYLWYSAATGGTGSATAPIPSATAVGTTSYFVSQTVSGCEGPRAEIKVIVSACATVAPTVVSPVNYTVGSTPIALPTQAGYLWYSAATGGTGSATAPLPSATAAGTTSYFVSQTVSGCEGPRAEIKVIVSACATVAPTVVSLVNYTVGSTPIALPTQAGYLWYSAATGGTGSATAPIPATTAVGTTSYFVSQTVSGCEGPRAEIKVIITCATVAPTVPVAQVKYCIGDTGKALSATGTALKWYTTATGGTGTATAPIPATATVGTTSYFVSQTINGCEGARAEIKVIIEALPVVPVVKAVTYCKDAPALALTATALTGNTLNWYGTRATGGTASATAPVPLTTTTGSISYYVSQTNANGCEGPRVAIVVTVKALPLAPTVVDTSYCKDVTAGALIAIPAAGLKLNWYGTAATGGTASATAPTPGTSVTTAYYVSQTDTAGCEGPRAKLNVVIKPVPVAPTIANALVEYCQSVTASPLAATPAASGVLNWYGQNPTGGTASAAAPTPSTDKEGVTAYYVGQTLEGCVSDRAKIEVKINVAPKPKVLTPSVSYCLGVDAAPLSAEGTSLKWYLTLTDTNPRTSPLTPFTEKVDDYSFYVTQTLKIGSTTCESAKEEIKVHIQPLPSATISGNSSIVPGQTATILVNFTGDAPWKYTVSDGQTGTTSNSSLQIRVSPSVTTNYVITEVSNACGKGLQNGVAVVTVLIPTITTGLPSVSNLCAGKTFTVPFQKSGDFPAGNTFAAQISTVNDVTTFVSIPSVVNGNTLTATLPDTTKGGNYFIRIVSQGTGDVVPGSVSSVKIVVTPLPVATISGPSNIYMGEIVSLKIDLTGDGPWTLNLNDGAKDTLISTSNTPLNVRISPKTTSIYKITSVSNACGVGRAPGTFRVQVDPVLGTEPPVVAANWVKIYPTMIEDQCTVELTSALSAKDAVVEIFDLSGRSLSRKAIRQKVTEVDFSQKPRGMYLLKVQNGERTSVQRIFKP